MNNRTELEKQFKEECTVINLDAEYPGNPTHIKWAIITGYSREELENKYADILVRYRPYEVASPEMKEIYAEYYRNEDKYRKRRQRNVSIFDLDEEVDAWCPAVPSFADEAERLENEAEEREKTAIKVRYALSKLTETQRRRFLRYYNDRLTVTQIAAEEGVKDHTSIVKSIESAKKRFKKYFEKTPHFVTPLSKYSEEVIPVSGESSSSTSND